MICNWHWLKIRSGLYDALGGNFWNRQDQSPCLFLLYLWEHPARINTLEVTSNIREDKGYTYSPFSSLNNRKGSSVWIEQADVTSEHTVESLLEIEKEIKKLGAIEPSKDELKGIQNYEAGIFVLQNSLALSIKIL